jgi:hypothetical protein
MMHIAWISMNEPGRRGVCPLAAIYRRQEASMSIAHTRIALIVLAGVTLLAATVEMAEAQRQPRPWCLSSGRGGPGGGLPDCTYHTQQQCLQSISGAGDGCYLNTALGLDRI